MRMWCLKWNVSVAGTHSSTLTPTTIQWVFWPGESLILITLAVISSQCLHNPMIMGERDFVTEGWYSRGTILEGLGALEKPQPKVPSSLPMRSARVSGDGTQQELCVQAECPH